jgi:hypothetical protein
VVIKAILYEADNEILGVFQLTKSIIDAFVKTPGGVRKFPILMPDLTPLLG